VRGATRLTSFCIAVVGVSIHAPREGRDVPHGGAQEAGERVSIHAPREGRDQRRVQHHRLRGGVSIHAPREGRDLRSDCVMAAGAGFNPRAP